MGLTDEQRRAVERTGQDVCVVAGPGSGKTRILVERFRWRVSEQHVSPLEILAVTFTEKAAVELRQRLARNLPQDPELQAQIERAPVSTLDGFCARLLREHAIEAGIDPAFQVLEEFGAWSLLYDAAQEALDGLLREKPAAMRALLEAVDFSEDPTDCLIRVYQAMRVAVLGAQGLQPKPAPDCTAAVRELMEAVRTVVCASPAGWGAAQREALAALQDWGQRVLRLPESPVSLEHFRVLGEFDCNLTRFKKNNPVYDAIREIKQRLLEAARQALVAGYYAPQRALLWEALGALDRIYHERKRALNALDFGDLEEVAISLLREHEPARTLVRESYQEILMDELQDTNPLQWMLMDQIRRPDRFFAVGDINQSIYGFRHADPDVFRSYRDRLQGEGKAIDYLAKNHRSRREILAAAETILGGAEGIEPHHLEAARPFFEKRGPSVELIAAIGETTEEAAQIEAKWVARRIRELEGTLLVQERDQPPRPARFRDIAVLLRNVNALAEFEQAFRDFGVPCVIGRGKRFFEAREVNDLVHWLRVLANPRDEISMAAVLRSPLAGISDETLLRIKPLGNLAEAISCLEHIDTAGFDAGDLERLIRFREELARMRALADDISPDRLLTRVIDRADYESGLDARARANVRKFLAQLRNWFADRPRPLAELVRELERLRAFDPDQAAAPPEDSLNAVRVMTVHGAKGLEFPVVFLAALHKGVLRSQPPLAFSLESGLVARWRDPIRGDGVKDLPYAVFAEELGRKQGEEENRLLYVAITRAEEHLVFSFAAASGRKPRNWASRVVSAFGLDPEPADNHPAIEHVGPDSLPVRVLRVNAPPEPAAAAAEREEQGPVLLARPQAAEQWDSTAPVTSIALFERCPRLYYLSRYLGWDAARRDRGDAPEADGGEMDASELGVQVHSILAGEPPENASEQAHELAARFHSSELGRRAAAAKRAEREFDFLLALEGVVLRGRIDIWFEDGSELVVVDYKTDEVTPEEALERSRTYGLQLQLYALALQALTGRVPDRAFVYFLRPNAAIAASLAPDDLEAARASVRNFARAQSELCFPLREGDYCRRCAFYRGLCPARPQGV